MRRAPITRLVLAAGVAAAALLLLLVLILVAPDGDEERVRGFAVAGLVLAGAVLLALGAILAHVLAAAREAAGGAAPAPPDVTLVAHEAEGRRSDAAHRAGERLAAARSLGEVATIALAELAMLARAEEGALWVVEPDDAEALLLEAVVGLDPADLPGLVRADDTPRGRAVAAQEVVEDGPALHLPLSSGGRVLGIATLQGARTAQGVDREQVVELAERASVALANAVSFRAALRTARVNRAVLDATPDPVGLVGTDGTLIAHNAAMAELWARHPGFDDPDGPEADEHGRVTLGERTYSRYAGPVRDEAGEEMGRLLVLRDITAEREGERLKDEFFALVSHELRTPLTSIIGYLELVQDDASELPPDARRFLEVVDRNAKRLLRLVGDMLFVAQAEAGRLTLERTPLDLGEVVADAVEAAQPAAERGGVRLRLEAEPSPPVDGDRDRLGQLVDNLVSNALKFTPEGGEVVVSLRPDVDGTVQLAVRDDGMGVPEAEQQHLFERFFRSTAATTRAVPGAGLGLTIVKTIAEVHDGRIALTSQEGVGTTVRVRLPASGGEQP